MKVDTHVHFWQYEKTKDAWITDNMKVLQEDYLPGKLAQTLKNNDVDACVAVQASQTELETHFLIELSHMHDIIKGIVGWIDLRKDDIEERLHYFSQYPIIKGWRHVVQGEPNDFLSGKEFQRGVSLLPLYNYTYDILIYHHQLKPALQFVSKFPEHKMVIDHCAKPDIANRKIDEWKAQMKEMAQNPNIYCKLSGLFVEAKWKQWSAADFYPYLDVVFEAFGTDRLMFGSDWPVILLSGMYVQWKSLLEKYMENMAQEEKNKVFGENAVRFYKLYQ